MDITPVISTVYGITLCDIDFYAQDIHQCGFCRSNADATFLTSISLSIEYNNRTTRYDYKMSQFRDRVFVNHIFLVDCAAYGAITRR